MLLVKVQNFVSISSSVAIFTSISKKGSEHVTPLSWHLLAAFPMLLGAFHLISFMCYNFMFNIILCIEI